MTRIILYISIIFLLTIFNAKAQHFTYPDTKKVEQSDFYFGYEIQDPYRWLEDQNSNETKEWIDQQNKFTHDYLNNLPGTYSLRESIKKNTEIYFSTPEKKGNYYFILKPRVDGKEISIYYRRNIKLDMWDELFVTKGLDVKKGEYIYIDEYEISANSKYLAYTFDRNGSDWKELKIADLEKLKNLPDHLYDIKHSTIVWRGNGFYYTKYDRASGDEQYKAQSINGKLYYHVLGTPQDKDSLIFKKTNAPSNFFNPLVSKDERYLILVDQDPVKNTLAYYYFDFKSKTQTGLLPLFKKGNNEFRFLGTENDNLLFMTRINGAKKVISVNPANPLKWVEKIKSIEQLIVLDIYYHKERLYQLCMYGQQEFIVIFNSNGSIIEKVEIPLGHSVEFKGVDEQTNQLLLAYGSYFHPPVFAGMDLDKFKFKILEHIAVNYEMNDYEIKKVMCKSDTAYVPMLLMYKKTIKFNGNNPVLMEFYGGFGKIHKPAYDAGRISFIESGGIYAFAMIRGGGEKGNYWHEDAILNKRQNSINDIANCAKYLIKEKYTNSSKIGISGGSHGGLMTAAVALQYPNLFAAAIPIVGVHDMLRFEKFTIGVFHADEFGSVKDSLMFMNLKSYSPIHNVKKGIEYPAMLFMTANYDDRVPPLHSYKMAATMQENVSITNPVLLRVEKNAGHNGSRSYDTYINETTDFYKFIFNALGVKKEQ